MDEKEAKRQAFRELLQMLIEDKANKEQKMALVKSNMPSELENKFNDVDLRREGTTIIIPEDITLKEAAEWILKKDAEESKTVAVHEVFEGVYALDGAIALSKALHNLFGWVSNMATPGFWGSTPPTMVTVRTGHKSGDAVQVPWGRFSVPNITGWLASSIQPHANYPTFVVTGEVRYGDMPKVRRLLTEIRMVMENESIYRGKAIRVDFSWTRDPNGEGFDLTRHSPRFIDVGNYTRDGLILPKSTERQVDIELFSFLKHKEAMRGARIPLKRSVLLYGPFGTGKTLTANVSAHVALEHGWTFIYLAEVEDLALAMKFAQQYQPAVVFAEDIDRKMSGDRSVEVDTILNTIDGIDYKNKEIFCVLTSNNVISINPAMLRPGRLDSIIEIPPLDAESAVRLIKLYGGEFIDPKADLTAVGEAVNDMIPASIREIVERSKAACIADLGVTDIIGKVNNDHLLVSAANVKQHMQLLRRAEDARKKKDPFTRAGEATGTAIVQAVLDAQMKVQQYNSRELAEHAVTRAHARDLIEQTASGNDSSSK